MALSERNARNLAFVLAVRYLEAAGFQILECHPYGAVHKVHEEKSWHYDSFLSGARLHSRGADVNWPGGGGTEHDRISAQVRAIRSFGVAIIFNKTGEGEGPAAHHGDHAHLDQGSYTNLGSGKVVTKKSDLTVYSTQTILHTHVKNKDNLNGSATMHRIKLVREASLLGGNDFPNGVKATQEVIGAALTGEWDLQSRQAHDKTVKKLKALWRNTRLYGGTIDATWDSAFDDAMVKFQSVYK